MDKTMNRKTRNEVLGKMKRRYGTAGTEHKSKLLDQAQELFGYHRKAAFGRCGHPQCSLGRGF